MTVQKLVEFVNNNKNKMLKADQLQVALKKELEVKEYLSIKDKKQLIEDIINDCILYDNGIFKFDEIEKYITFTMKAIESYTNIELSMDIEDDYDGLCRAKLLAPVIDLFQSEYEEIGLLLRMKCEYILNENNIEAQVGKFLNNISDKLDDFAVVLSNQVDKFDISKLPIQKEDIVKILDFIDTQK